MTSGKTLNHNCNAWGCFLTSPTEIFRLVVQRDCSLILFSITPSEVQWQPTPTSWRGLGSVCFLAAQTNGQLVMYQENGGNAVPIWTSNPAPAVPAAGGYTLSLSDSGALSWAENNGNVLFSTPAINAPVTNNFAQPGACPAQPFIYDMRLNCFQTTYQACFAAGCCWDPVLFGYNSYSCYTAQKTAWYGTPGSDPGQVRAPTSPNPGRFMTIATLPDAPLGVAYMPTTNKLVFSERISQGFAGSTHSYLLNLDDLSGVPLHPPTDIFCNGGVLLPDGTLLSVGGWTGNFLCLFRGHVFEGSSNFEAQQ